jgi:hypothetical protein
VADGPENLEWLIALVRRSPVIADEDLRRHWSVVVRWLSLDQRYTLAAILLDVEHACAT